MSDILKWIYSTIMLAAVVLWGLLTINVIYEAATNKMTIDILAASGASAITGALIAWNGQIVTYWFRKRPSGDKKNEH